MASRATGSRFTADASPDRGDSCRRTLILRGRRRATACPAGRTPDSVDSSRMNARIVPSRCIENRSVPSRHVTSLRTPAGRCGAKRSPANLRCAVDCMMNCGAARATYSTTASRQLPWCGISRMSQERSTSPRAALAARRAAGSVSMSPESRIRAAGMPCAASTVTESTSDRSLSRFERNPATGQITRQSALPSRSTSPAEIASIATPCTRMVARSSMIAGLVFSAARSESCTKARRRRAYRTTSAIALRWSRSGCEMMTASTTPPRASIHGSSARDATFPIELDPPSNRTRVSPDSTATAVPSPIANIVHSKWGGASRRARVSVGSMTSAAATPHAAVRTDRLPAPIAMQDATPIVAPTDQCAPPRTIDPAPHRSDISTSHVCSHAAHHVGHARIEVSGGQTAPMTAFGYASASVAVESGAHRSVSSVPKGCSVPKWTRTMGTLATKAASPEASARERNSPPMPTQAGCPRLGSSRGIARSQRMRIGSARCRNASTHAKLS